MPCVSALSTERKPDAAFQDASSRLAEGLAGATADLALIFASAHHADALARLGREVRRRGLARHVIGCTGESIIGEDREVEAAPALSLWAARLPGVGVTPHRLSYDARGVHGITLGPPPADRPDALIVLGDPFSFPPDQFLKQVNEAAPGLPVVGGMASASQVPRGNRLVLDDDAFDAGAVAVGLSGSVALRTVVSQGCRPVGRPLIVTKAENNMVRELGRRPALEVLREIFEEMPPDDQERAQQGLHIGRVINEYQESFHRGDFLVRNVLGADEAGGIAVTDVFRVGQTVQFHVRDAATADEDLLTLLEHDRDAHPGGRVTGALLFSCNGRGTRLFDEPDHDVSGLRQVFGPLPVAGFFAMGELGPVGGKNFVHGYTASIILFGESEESGA
jgi:small ligand-binding sensory domain FIST